MEVEPQWLGLGIFGGSIVLSIVMIYYRRYQRRRAARRRAPTAPRGKRSARR